MRTLTSLWTDAGQDFSKDSDANQSTVPGPQNEKYSGEQKRSRNGEDDLVGRCWVSPYSSPGQPPTDRIHVGNKIKGAADLDLHDLLTEALKILKKGEPKTHTCPIA
jgi:hypothetical protein